MQENVIGPVNNTSKVAGSAPNAKGTTFLTKKAMNRYKKRNKKTANTEIMTS